MTDHLLAESAVRQLHARYIDAVWRQDAVSYGDCWQADGEWKILGLHLHGRAEIVRTFENLMQPLERVIQFFHPPILHFGDGEVSGRTYVTEHNRFRDGRTGSTIGIYYERYVDDGDRWRFASRHFNLYYIGPPDISGPFFDIPDYGPPPAMPGKDDPATPPASAVY
jgi:SnoaL-like domain